MTGPGNLAVYEWHPQLRWHRPDDGTASSTREAGGLAYQPEPKKQMTLRSPRYDALIIGGGPAGFSAALALGRSTRRVLLAAYGPTRNAPAHAAHNLFTRDGTPPAELIRIARDEVAAYDVTIRDDQVVDIQREARDFTVRFGKTDPVEVRGIVLAPGVRDVLPTVAGIRELWGNGVFHCPYCHGWEVRGQPLAVYGRGDDALHLSRLLRGWTSDLILFTDGPSELGDEETRQIRDNGIVIRDEPIERLVGSGGLEAIVLRSGDAIPRSGLFVRTKLEVGSDLPERLGCTLTPEGRIEADPFGRTKAPWVFAAGDAAQMMQSVVVAAASGATAAAMLNHDLLTEDFAARAASPAG